MATVTVFTAERSQAIEDNTIVDGVVNASGRLVLTKHNGNLVDAGPIIAADGTPFVGQYTTAGRPAAGALTGKILWDIDEQGFFTSNGAIWELFGSGGSGDVTLAQTSVAAAQWFLQLGDVEDADDNRATSLAKAKAYTDSSSVSAQIASTDTEILNIYTMGGITYLDVSNISTASSTYDFMDSNFSISDNQEPDIQITFSANNLTETHEYSFPDQDGLVITENSTNNIANKTLMSVHPLGGTYGKVAGSMIAGLNYPITSIGVPAYTYASFGRTTQPPQVIMHCNNPSAIATEEDLLDPGGVLSGQEIGRFAFRAMESTNGVYSTDMARISAHPRENVTSTTRGCDLRLAVVNMGTQNPLTALAIQAAVTGASESSSVSVRNRLVVGSSSATIMPADGYIAEFKDATAAGRGFGYGITSGTTGTQLTSKSTTVTATTPNPNGTLTTVNSSLAASTTVSFQFTNTSIALNDHVFIQHVSGGTMGAYNVSASAQAGSANVYIRNITTAALAESLTLRFIVIKGSVT